MSRESPSFFRAALRDEADGLQRISRDIRLADVATLANGLLGLAAILLAASGRPILAAHLVLLGVVVDGVDGALARIGLGGGPLGPTLDTLADTVTFGVAPAVILVLSSGSDPTLTVLAALFLVAVLLRLARFESLRETSPRNHFSGLSSPGGALVVLVLVLVDVQRGLLLAGILFASFLMLSRVRYPKLRGGLGVLAVAVILAVLAAHWLGALQSRALWLLLSFMAVYVLAGPFYVLARAGPAPEAS